MEVWVKYGDSMFTVDTSNEEDIDDLIKTIKTKGDDVLDKAPRINTRILVPGMSNPIPEYTLINSLVDEGFGSLTNPFLVTITSDYSQAQGAGKISRECSIGYHQNNDKSIV
jgi:hypothetical protein